MNGRISVSLGVVCLLLAAGVAWLLPKDGVAYFLSGGSGDGKLASMVTKMEREEVRYEWTVAEEYLGKAERGMEAKEVRWVVEDFLVLGLDVDYPEDSTARGYLELRKKREKWYLSALVSGLRLTKEQELQAADAIRVVRDRDFAEFREYLKGLKPFEHEGRAMLVFDGGKARRFIDAESWLHDEDYSPRLLCELSDEQKAVTWDSAEISDESGVLRDLANGEGSHEDWLKLYKNPSETGVGIKRREVDPFDPSFVHNIEEMGGVFPLSEFQFKRLTDPSWDGGDRPLLEQMKVLQRDQLRMYMLHAPSSARVLLSELEK